MAAMIGILQIQDELFYAIPVVASSSTLMPSSIDSSTICSIISENL
jgi:hypothetical protein